VAELKPSDIPKDGFANDFYQEKITGNEVTYNILHLTDMHTDLEYVVAADSSCRGWVCCHANRAGRIPEELDEDRFAGPFGHKGCDMPLGGSRAMLTEFKKN